jgi:D-alanyl-D-alanine carboxypeptidase/D-alanyl-D-alanine-endopeptidase (penicillin-binding protein 4)
MRCIPSLALLCVSALQAQSLEVEIRKALDQPAVQRGVAGIHVVDLDTGRTVFEHNARVPFTPASNTKLFSTALALLRLGPDYRFETTVTAPSRPSANGRVESLRIAGGADPTLSARTYPYRKGPIEGDPLAPLEALAAAVVKAGVRDVAGEIIGDDTLYPWDPYPEGWTVGDTVREYGAPVSALMLHDNALLLTIRPGAAGLPASINIAPPTEHYTFMNLLRVGPGLPRRISVDRATGSRVVVISGTAPPNTGAAVQSIAIDDPALYAAAQFKRILERLGVRVRGVPRAAHRTPGEPFRTPGGTVLASRLSPPLVEVLKVINKVSQNLHAEIVLLETARRLRGDATRQFASEELDVLLEECGAPKDDANFYDGSGLSRRTLITPQTVTRLLARLNASPHRDAFRHLLPIAGEDGTLAARFKGFDAVAGIRAKTGTISHVAALSGYAGGEGSPRLAFSIIANNHTSPAAEIRAAVDTIAVAILRKGTP